MAGIRGFITSIAARLGFARKSPRRGTGYAAAEISRLTASLRSDTEFINNTLRYQLRPLRARSRQAAQNNPFARRFVQMCVDNIAGPNPFKLEGWVKTARNKPDVVANEKIERAWKEYTRKGVADISGKWSWAALLRLIVRIWATDGEVLIRVLKGPERGAFGCQLQIIDIDRLWEQKNEALANGGAIHMGVEVDAAGKPVAYHVMRRRPSSWQTSNQYFEFDRIPAGEIIHVFVPEAAEQVRGVPWMYAALLNLVHMGAFEEAAVINARIGATQMGFITTPDGEAPAGDSNNATTGVAEFDAEPGTFRVLADGQMVESWQPQFPQAAVEPFIKAMLRGIASGLGVAYHNLASDLEGVNYSSARIGEQDERDGWKVLQNFFDEHFLQPFIVEHWMTQAVMAGKLPFDLSKLDKYAQVYFQPRRWEWVDPLKEVTARVDAINNGLTSRTRVIAESGDDIGEVFAELQVENEMIASHKLTLGEPAKPAAAPAAPPAEPDADAAEDDDEKPTKAWDDGRIADGLNALASAVKSRPASVVNVAAPVVNVETKAPQIDVHVPPPVAMERVPIRDKDGVILKLVDQPVNKGKP